MSATDDDALRRLRADADGGSAEAMVDLGLRLVQGEGVSKDLADGVRWFQRAAEAGDPRGMFNLAGSLTVGRDAKSATTLAYTELVRLREGPT
jgi:TPR repeat protein